MNAQHYANFVAARFTKRHEGADGLMHCAVGISGESGELLDAVKKLWVYGKPLDRDNAIEELGDIEFYMQALRVLLNVSRDEILVENVAKLIKRYPVAYSDALAIARLDKGDQKGRSPTGDSVDNDYPPMCPNCVTPWKCNGPHTL